MTEANGIEAEMDDDDIDRAAVILIDAHRTGRAVLSFPDALKPKSVGEVYAIQHAVARAFEPIAGWKVAIERPQRPAQYAAILRGYETGATVARAFVDAVEIELGFQFRNDMPPRDDYADAEVEQALLGVRPIVELVGSRFAPPQDADAFLQLADAQNATGMVIASSAAAWTPAASDYEFWLEIDGVAVERRGAPVPARTHMQALCWLLRELGRQGVTLRADQFVITGARVGPVKVRSGATIAGGAISPDGRRALGELTFRIGE